MSARIAMLAATLALVAAVPASAQAPETVDEERYEIELDVGAGVILGLMPGPGVGAVAAILIQSPYFLGVEVVGSFYPFVPQDTGFGEARWLAAFGGVLLCTDAATFGAFSLRGCAGGELGFMQAHGDVDPALSYVTGQILFRARLSFRVVEGFVIWTRPTFAINARSDPYLTETMVLFDPEPIGGLFDLGVGWIFD